jgi:hypothetical protein
MWSHIENPFIVGLVQWAASLREYPWFPTPGVPTKPPWEDDLSTTPTKPTADNALDQAMDRIGRADRDNPKFEYFKDRWAHFEKGEDDWGVWERFCFRMAAALAKVEPHYPEFTDYPAFTGLLVSTLSTLPDCLFLYRFTIAARFLPRRDCT